MRIRICPSRGPASSELGRLSLHSRHSLGLPPASCVWAADHVAIVCTNVYRTCIAVHQFKMSYPVSNSFNIEFLCFCGFLFSFLFFFLVYCLHLRVAFCFKCSFCFSDSIVVWVKTFELWLGGF